MEYKRRREEKEEVRRKAAEQRGAYAGKTRQDYSSTESKVTQVVFNNCNKMPYRFWRDTQLSERDGTLQCSAGPEWYGCHSINDTLASTWCPAVGQPVGVRWVPRSTQKKKSTGTIADRVLNVVCTLKLFTPKSKSCAPLRSVSLVAYEYSKESLIFNEENLHLTEFEMEEGTNFNENVPYMSGNKEEVKTACHGEPKRRICPPC